MSKGVSIIICCFNSANRIKETLNHLALQKTSEKLNWEIIIVDNASTDETLNVCLGLQHKFPQHILRIVSEHKPGLTNARIRGVQESSYEIGIFCDDDNWLLDNYLSTAFKLLNENSKIGIIGAYGIPVFETEKPPYFDDNQAPALAVGKQAKNNGKIINNSPSVYGAGMVFNLNLFKKLIIDSDYRFKTTDRIGNTLISGGDYEICQVFSKAGYEIHFSDELIFKHYIPSRRTELKYYKKLFLGIGYSQFLIQGSKGWIDIIDLLRSVKFICQSYISILLKKYNNQYPYKYIHLYYSLYSNLGYIKSYLNKL